MFNEKTVEILENLKKDVDKALTDLSEESFDSLEEGIKKFEQSIIEMQNKAIQMIKDSDSPEEEKIKIIEFINNPNLKSEDWEQFKEGKKENLPDE